MKETKRSKGELFVILGILAAVVAEIFVMVAIAAAGAVWSTEATTKISNSGGTAAILSAIAVVITVICLVVGFIICLKRKAFLYLLADFAGCWAGLTCAEYIVILAAVKGNSSIADRNLAAGLIVVAGVFFFISGCLFAAAVLKGKPYEVTVFVAAEEKPAVEEEKPVEEEPAEEPAPVVAEEAPAEEPVEEEKPVEEPVEEAEPAEEAEPVVAEEAPAEEPVEEEKPVEEPAEEPAPVEEEKPVEEPVAEEEKPAEEAAPVEEKPVEKKPAPAKKKSSGKKKASSKRRKKKPTTGTGKVYHVSKRGKTKKGGWKVKGEGAEKANKHFKTQKEAIAYAKELAGSTGRVRVHSVKGTIRRA